MPAPFGPTMPIRSPRWAARNGTRATVCGSVAGVPSAASRAATGQVADDETLDPDDHLAGPCRPGPRERGARDRELAPLPRRLGPLGLQPLEAGLVLVHLGELAMAAIALDEFLLPGDLLGLGGRRP